jgi:hypothetical protein
VAIAQLKKSTKNLHIKEKMTAFATKKQTLSCRDEKNIRKKYL